MRIEFALCVWSQNARFVVTFHCSRCVLDLVVGVHKDLGPSAPGATAPALLYCRLVVSRSIYIYISFIYLRVRVATYISAAFTTLLLRLLCSTLRVVFSYSIFASRVFVIVFRSFIIFICWLLLLTYIYINL